MRFLLPLLMLVLFGCCEPKRTNNSLEKRQEAIAKEFVSIEYAGTDAIFQLNNTNAVEFVHKMESLSDRLDKILSDLDTLRPFSVNLRKATLKKLSDQEVLAQLRLIRTERVALQPEVAKTTFPVTERYISTCTSVCVKIGLLADAKGNLVEVEAGSNGQTNSP